jgi:glycyl-tRNA synthetase alpha chain
VADPVTIQDLILALKQFWRDEGVLLAEPFDMEVGAGTQSPLTFFRSLGPQPWRVAYVQPSRRPVDGRYGENPNRLYQHHQFQVVLKPAPDNVVELYLKSLESLGLDRKKHDVRFVEDNWEAPTVGAAGLGWEVWLDGMEITQFTYFQQMAGYECRPVSVEMTYGLERLASYLAGTDDVWSVKWAPGVSYRELYGRVEWEQATYSFESADPVLLNQLFDLYERESLRLAALGLERPAYECQLKASHLFNTLDARGAIAVVQRQAYIGRLRTMAKRAAEVYLERVVPHEQQ